MVLPEEFVLPPLGHLLAIVVGAGLVGTALWRSPPPVTRRTAVALAPWMGLGGALHVAWVLGVGPSWVQPALSAPTVYLTTAVVAGAVWAAAATRDRASAAVDGALGTAGAIGLAGMALVFVRTALRGPGLRLFWPTLGIVVAMVLTGAVWMVLRRIDPETAHVTGWAGIVVVFGHALDGATTAIGMDVLGTGERSPIPRMIMELAGSFPTAELLGVGWAFVLVKVLLAAIVIWLFREYVEEVPSRGYLLLALFAAVGMGPGAHNLLLFLQAG